MSDSSDLIAAEMAFSRELAAHELTQKQRELFSSETVSERRSRVSSLVFDYYEGKVQFGPFKGMQMSREVHWGASDKASMVLGLYEKEVTDYIMNSAVGKEACFIDIGAADGHYAIGFLQANRFKNSICFEASTLGHKVIKENARQNDVEERVKVHGVAEANFCELIGEENLKGSMILIDIEGGEFDILNISTLEKLQNCHIVIEVHNWIEGFESKYEKLLNAADKFFNLSVLKVGQREIPEIELLEHFPDDNRWLLLSEGRPNRMRWLCLSPKK